MTAAPASLPCSLWDCARHASFLAWTWPLRPFPPVLVSETCTRASTTRPRDTVGFPQGRQGKCHPLSSCSCLARHLLESGRRSTPPACHRPMRHQHLGQVSLCGSVSTSRLRRKQTCSAAPQPPGRPAGCPLGAVFRPEHAEGRRNPCAGPPRQEM